MKRSVIVAAMLGAGFCSAVSARAQEWSGVAGIAASRGYRAAPGVSAASSGQPAAAASPAAAEALAVPRGAAAPGVPVGGLAGDIEPRRVREGLATGHVPARHRHRARRSGAA